MPLTPRTIVVAARGGLGLAAIGALILGFEPFDPPALFLTGTAWGVSMLTLLSFPRVRRKDLLTGLCAGCTFAGYLATSGSIEARALGALAGLAAPLALSITFLVMRTRHLAASNWHMPFTEWQQLDRRRRRDTPIVKLPPETVVIDADRNY